VRFGAFNWVSTSLYGERKKKPIENMIAGACAGAAESLLAVTPVRAM
jgi:hypothetical protein